MYMTKFLDKMYIRVILSVAVGFFVASTLTHITYPCTGYFEGIGCVSFEDAIMHPSDLLNNKQDSLTTFASKFAVISLATFTLLSIAHKLYTKKTA